MSSSQDPHDRPSSHSTERSEAPAWKRIVGLFRAHGLPEPPTRLRDELVTHLLWAREGAFLKEALEPFADIAGEGSDDYPDETKVVVTFGRTTHYALKLGDLRRAQRAYYDALTSGARR